jgi:hypothetical protein
MKRTRRAQLRARAHAHSDTITPMASTARRASPALRTPAAVSTRTRGAPAPRQRDADRYSRSAGACAAEKIKTSDTAAAPCCAASQPSVHSMAGWPATGSSAAHAPPPTTTGPSGDGAPALASTFTSARTRAWKPTSSAKASPPPTSDTDFFFGGMRGNTRGVSLRTKFR